MPKLLPGLLLTVCVAALAGVCAGYIPGIGSVCLAILIGIGFGNLMPFSDYTEAGVAWAERHILPIAIALMGTELELHRLGNLGVSALLIVVPAMAVSIVAAVALGRRLNLSTPAALMLGIGNSVCGSSAVLASAPALKAEKHDVAAAIAAVNLLGTVGMFLLPAVAVALSLSPMNTAYLIGGSLQAVGQVVASGFSISGPIGQSALVIKMLRVLMIGPIVMLLHLMFRSKDSAAAADRKRTWVPGYILGFVACAGVADVFHGDTVVLPHVETLAHVLLTVAMAAVGCRIHFRSLVAQGPRALLLVTVLSVIQTGAILVLIRAFA